MFVQDGKIRHSNIAGGSCTKSIQGSQVALWTLSDLEESQNAHSPYSPSKMLEGLPLTRTSWKMFWSVGDSDHHS